MSRLGGGPTISHLRLLVLGYSLSSKAGGPGYLCSESH